MDKITLTVDTSQKCANKLTLDKHCEKIPDPDKLQSPRRVEFAQRSVHLPQRLTPLCFCLGMDEVGKTLDLSQIQFAILKGPFQSHLLEFIG